MNLAAKIGLLLIGGALLVGCEETRQKIGGSKTGPDEFSVYTRAPLSLPPEFKLRPPEPGAIRPQGVDPRSNAKEAITGGRPATAEQSINGPDGRSPGTVALLGKTGADKADPAIRATVNKESSVLADDQASLVDKIIFWRDADAFGNVVDPDKESKRIQQNQALGKPVTGGDTPVITRKERAFFEGLFN